MTEGMRGVIPAFPCKDGYHVTNLSQCNAGIYKNNRGGRLAGMSLTLRSPQCFALAIIIFGFFGFLQGWRIALVLMAFTLAAILFLFIGGAEGIASFIFVRLPETLNTLTGGALFSRSMPPPAPNQVLIAALVALAVAMVLGLIVGNRAFAGKPGSVPTKDHFLGIIPGLVTGYAIISYASHIFAGTNTLSVGVTTPITTSVGNSIVVVIAVIALILGLLTGQIRKIGFRVSTNLTNEPR